MIFKCPKCAVVATQATLSSPLKSCGFPLSWTWPSSIHADVAAWTRPHSLYTGIHGGFDLLRNNSRFHSVESPRPSCFIAWFYNTNSQPRWAGEFSYIKTGPGSFWFLNELQSGSQARGDFHWTCFHLIRVNRASSIRHLKGIAKKGNMQNNLFLKLCS